MVTMHPRTQLMVTASLFAVLTGIGAQIRIPFPLVPMTLQVFFVLLSGILLGPKGGVLSQALYLLMGLLGLPVFANGGGLQTILDPTFGFLVGFIFAAGTAGAFADAFPRPSFFLYGTACLAGLFALYIPGILYLYVNVHFVMGKPLTLLGALQLGFLPFIGADLVKSAAVSGIALKIVPRLNPLLLDGRCPSKN